MGNIKELQVKLKIKGLYEYNENKMKLQGKWKLKRIYEDYGM